MGNCEKYIKNIWTTTRRVAIVVAHIMGELISATWFLAATTEDLQPIRITLSLNVGITTEDGNRTIGICQNTMNCTKEFVN